MDLENIARQHLRTSDVGQRLDAAVGPNHAVDARRPRLATGQAERRMHPAIGQDARRHCLQETHPPHATVATCPAPGATRALADGIAVQAHRKAELQHLRVGQARVGHVRLHDAGAIEAARQRARRVEHPARPAAARDGLVILVARVAEGEVVHGRLAAGHHAQRAEQRVGDAGRRFHVTRDHRGGRVRVQHGARRDDDLQGLQATGVERNVVVHQRAEHIEHRRHADRRGRVEVVGLLGAGAGEVDGGAAAGRIDTDRDLDLRAVVQRQREGAILQARDDAAHRLLGVVLHMAHVGLHHVQAELVHHLAQFLHAFLVGGDLRPEIGHVLRGVS